LKIKPASSCTAEKFVFHFGNTAILVQKDGSHYQGEFVWETDFLAVHSTRNKGKGFYFIAFEFDDNYQITLKETDKLYAGLIFNSPLFRASEICFNCGLLSCIYLASK
jgi:hypothetical protein